MTTTVHFEVVGEEKIHCGGCESRIATALGCVPGVAAVRANAETQRVSVTLDPARTSADEMRARLEKLGYRTA
ncbi:MAG: heavy-metal-associated domain-containing protein [Betaproteobacteria bacterium]